jgi:tRNA A-37 threonylcarbamoyl transferase component Bud32/tetratricopeptide (TPR) repeat protein
MGSVYLGKDPELEREVAIKLLHRTGAGSSHARTRFREEARALARMSHPGIVTIYEIGDHEAQQYIAMEYLPGRSLRELLLVAPPPRERVRAIVAEVARAVAAAHARGILHRDIKPENVVVGDEGVKVVDFGLARRLGAVTLPSNVTRETMEAAAFDQTVQLLVDAEAATQTALATLRTPDSTLATEAASQGTVAGTLYGTPAYMAPEVLQGSPASQASDIYSLGVMLYECLAGRRPYEAPSLVQLIAIVVDGNEQPAPLADPLWPLIAKLLARDPDARPSLQVIADALQPPAAAAVKGSSWKPWIAGLALVGAAGVAFAISQRGEPTPAPVTARIVVDPIEGEIRTWSAQANLAATLGGVVAKLIGRDHLSAVATHQVRLDASLAEVIVEMRATHVVRGRLMQRGDELVGAIEILDTNGRFAIAIPVHGEVKRLPHLLADVAERVTLWIDPAATPARVPDPIRATPLLEHGKAQLQRSNWYEARVYFEVAVQVDPDSMDGWKHLASARGWTIAPAALVEDAIANCIRLERDPRRRQIWVGAAHFFRDEQPQAIAVLSAIDDSQLTELERVDLWNYLGEAHWHDGSPELAITYFKKLLARVPPYLPVRVHAYDWALFHAEYEDAARLYGVGERATEELAIARGDHERLAAGDAFPHNLHAQLILGRWPDPALVAKLDSKTRQLHDLAIAKDATEAHRVFGAIQRELSAQPTPNVWQDFGFLAEIVLAAGLEEAAREIIEMQRARGYQPFRGYHRHEILAAAVLRDPARIPTAGLTTRETKLAKAVAAELRGDHASAIAILTPLVREPTGGWEYPERAALIRNLAAARRTTELRAECAALSRPPIFRWSLLPLQRACKAYVR